MQASFSAIKQQIFRNTNPILPLCWYEGQLLGQRMDRVVSDNAFCQQAVQEVVQEVSADAVRNRQRRQQKGGVAHHEHAER